MFYENHKNTDHTLKQWNNQTTEHVAIIQHKKLWCPKAKLKELQISFHNIFRGTLYTIHSENNSLPSMWGLHRSILFWKRLFHMLEITMTIYVPVFKFEIVIMEWWLDQVELMGRKKSRIWKLCCTTITRSLIDLHSYISALGGHGCW